MNVVEIATADAADVQKLEKLIDFSGVFAAAPAQPHPSQYALHRIVARPAATEQQAVTRSREARIADFSDCMELAFGGLVLVGTLLFGAGLLRISWIDGHIANAALRATAHMVYAVAALLGCGTLYSAGLSIYCLLRR